jgi:hypothetical protein
MSKNWTSIGCGLASLGAYAGALTAVFKGYPHALENACPDGAPAPAAFWPLLLAAVGLAVVAFAVRPTERNEHGARSGAAVFVLLLVVAMPLAALVTAFGFEVSYACWE